MESLGGRGGGVEGSGRRRSHHLCGGAVGAIAGVGKQVAHMSRYERRAERAM